MLSRVSLLFTPRGTQSNIEFALVLFAALMVEFGAAFVLYAAVSFPGVAKAARERKRNATQVAQDHHRPQTDNTATQVALRPSANVIDVQPLQLTAEDVDKLLELPPAIATEART